VTGHRFWGVLRVVAGMKIGSGAARFALIVLRRSSRNKREVKPKEMVPIPAQGKHTQVEDMI
jgi:hypothetical protein